MLDSSGTALLAPNAPASSGASLGNFSGILQNNDSVPAATSVAPVVSTPSVISSQTGADIVTQQTQKLNALSSNPAPQTDAVKTPVPVPDTSTKSNPTAPEPVSTKVTLINPDTEQTVTFDNADLNKDNINSYLNSGYKLSDASGNVPSWLTPSGVSDSTAQTPTEKAQAAVDSASADLKSLTDNLTKYTISDADLAAQIQGITNQWDAREADMQRVNTSREGAIDTLGIRLGSRYAGGSGGTFGGIVSEEERQGVVRIGDLEAQKQSAIAAAKVAAQTQNWSVYSKQVDIAQKAYEDKIQAVKDLQTATATQNKLIADTLHQQQTDYYNQVTKPIQDVLSDATKNGLTDPDAISGIQNAKSVGEAMTLAGDYLQTGTGDVGDYLFAKRTALNNGTQPPTFDQWKAAADKAALDTEVAKAIAVGGVNFNYSLALEKAKQAMADAPNPDYNGEFQNTIKLAAASGTTKDQRTQITSNLQDFISGGDYGSAYAQITQAVASQLKGTAATSFSEALIEQTALSDLKDAISKYADAGGDTNILKGKEDTIQSKIGVLTTDPKYAAIATQLQTAFFAYRKNMTGAAFSPEESAAYQSVLPGKSNTLDLNLAKLEGANAYLNSAINGAITSVVGNGGVYIRERSVANDMVQAQQQNDPMGVLPTGVSTQANTNPIGI